MVSCLNKFLARNTRSLVCIIKIGRGIDGRAKSTLHAVRNYMTGALHGWHLDIEISATPEAG